jgi:hypothetical protein
MYRKEIVYNRETRDYAMYLDGELVGFACIYHEAEVMLDQFVFELMSGQYFHQHQVDNPHPPCPNCGGAHHVQRCPELLAAIAGYPLESALDAGRWLVRERVRDRASLIALLSHQTFDGLVDSATCEALYMRHFQRDITLGAIISRWRKMMGAS